jgi:hypothetical protein
VRAEEVKRMSVHLGVLAFCLLVWAAVIFGIAKLTWAR